MNYTKKYVKETLKHCFRANLLISPFVKEVERLYGLSEEELQAASEARFLEIFRKAITKSSFYKKLYAENGISINDIKGVADLSKLPVIDRSIVNQDPTQLLTTPKLFLSKSHTSGSTGAPLTVYNDYFSVLRDRAYFYTYRKKRGFTYGERLVSFRGDIERDIFKLKVDISNTLYLSCYQINPDNIKKYYDEMLSFAPVAIEGFPSSLYNMCCLFKEKGWKLSIPKCFTSSETLFDFERKMIEETLNTELYDHYGNTERTILLTECIDHRGYCSQPAYSINEFQDDCIITTSLTNSSFPLIRYKVPDIVTLNPEPSFANSEWSIATSVDGRIEDNIIAKDGTKYGIVYHLFEGVQKIKLAQFVQREKGCVDINIVPDGIFSDSERTKLLKNIDQRVGRNNMECNINIVDDSKIIYTRRNKFRQIVSLLDS